MKVLELLCEPISNGGQEAFVMNVYNHMLSSSIHIDLFTPYYCDNDLYREQVEQRDGCVYVGDLDFKPGGLKFNIITPIRRIVEQNHYDVVHIHSGSVFSLACAAYAAKRAHAKRIIVHSHCTADKHTIKRDFIKILSTPIINSCATDYCACSIEAGEWKFSKSICRDRLRVIRNGIDLSKFSYKAETRAIIRKKLNVDNDTFVIGHVGRFCYQKNQEYVISILKSLVIMGMRVKAVLIGSGETFDEVKQLSEDEGISDRVSFIGNVDNVDEYLQSFDMFLFPSRFEGLGIVAIEAQASGLPVIVSENVPDDVLITSYIVKIPLAERTHWLDCIVDRIIGKDDHSRSADINKLYDAGYDIKKTVEEIETVYEQSY